MTRCTSFACTRESASGVGFLLKSFGSGRISAEFFVTCTSKRPSANVFLHKPDLYDNHLGWPMLVQVHRLDPYKRKHPQMPVVSVIGWLRLGKTNILVIKTLIVYLVIHCEIKTTHISPCFFAHTRFRTRTGQDLSFADSFFKRGHDGGKGFLIFLFGLQWTTCRG